MASQAIFAAKLLAGEMPSNIEEAFEAAPSLYSPQRKKICRPVAPVPTGLIPANISPPFTIFWPNVLTKTPSTFQATRSHQGRDHPGTQGEACRVAGRSIDTGASAHTSIEPQRLEETLEGFWLAGEELDNFAINPHNPAVDKAILKRLGAAPFALGEKISRRC